MTDFLTPDELSVFEHITPEAFNLEELKKLGNVDITETLDENIITQTLNFVSFDGKVTFTKVKSYYKHNADYEKVKEYNSLIKAAVSKENYRQAAKLKTEKDKLLFTPAIAAKNKLTK